MKMKLIALVFFQQLLFSYVQLQNVGGGLAPQIQTIFDSLKKQAANQNHHGSHHSSHGKHYSHKGYGKHHNSNHNQLKVTMPSGNKYAIITSNESKQLCRHKSSFATMKPNDKKWKKEYNIVKKEVEAANKDAALTFNIVKIQKIFNPCLWKKYKYRKQQIYDEAQTVNERMLFHGSSFSHALALKGFDERYAKRTGNFGAGLYFSDRSSKSHASTKKKSDGTNQILLCRVMLGKVSKETTPKAYAHAPVGFQSVEAAQTDPEFIVYRGEQAYPEYLITYKV